jgi:pyruvate formate-lyase/glycerol dehydratase family glycyl radical enzyme
MSNVTFTDEGLDLQGITLQTMPRLQRMRDRHFFDGKPAICTELPRNITTFWKKLDKPPNKDDAGKLYQYVMEKKEPIIAQDNLLAGTTTTKPLGVLLYPDLYSLCLWPELETMATRKKNPFDITPEQIEELNSEIFPYWLDKDTIMEATRKGLEESDKECATLQERLAYYLVSKPECISHTIPHYGIVVERGLTDIIRTAQEEENKPGKSKEQKDFYQAVQLALQGIITYAGHLADEADRQADMAQEQERRAELKEMSRICRKVPAAKPETFHEALQAIWICKIALHQENANLALSLGRLDQILYPLYAEDIKKRSLTPERAVELVGCFWLSIADHVPMIPEAGEELFGGSGSNQAITLGGVDRDGKDAVNDLTYVMLKATELLALRDPNVNARYCPGVNPPEYLNRLCEVNITTQATPCFHNDLAVIDTLKSQDVTEPDARDYGVIGCVEPFSAGRTFGHSGAILFNLTSALERTLFGGKHRLTQDELIGMETTPAVQMNSFDEFQGALKKQLGWLIDRAVTLNTYCGHTHQGMHPCPMLSALMEGCMEKGQDVIMGGAKYNFSGATIIGLADVVDSLTAIQEFGFPNNGSAMPKMIAAIESNWGKDYQDLHEKIKKSPHKYGTDSLLATDNAKWLMEFLHDTFQSQEHYRGGKYTVGYWTMTNHAGFGMLTEALPSGRKKGESFASGITPVSGSAPVLPACLNFIASLDHRKITNGQALNLKFPLTASTTSALLSQTIQAYFLKTDGSPGGLQVQFNIMNRQKLLEVARDPRNPEYRDLLVRVSGYTAYFKDLNPQMQQEIINRAEYDLGTLHEIKYPYYVKQAELEPEPGLLARAATGLANIVRGVRNWFGEIIHKTPMPVRDFLTMLHDRTTEDFLEGLLRLMEFRLEDPLNLDKQYHKNIENFQGTYLFQEQKRNIETVVAFARGKMSIDPDNPPPADLTVTFKDGDSLCNFLLPSPTPKRDFLKKDILQSLLKHEVTVEGNLNLLYKFGYMANHLILHPLP